MPFLEATASGSNINTRKEYTPGQGGGFWGAETSQDLEAMEDRALVWAKTHGGVVSFGQCATLTSGDSRYARVDFRPWERGEELVIYAETTAIRDAHIFIGSLEQYGGEHGFEFAFGIKGNSESMIRWGIQGTVLTSQTRAALHSGKEHDFIAGTTGPKDVENKVWSKLWVKADSRGDVHAGLGGDVGTDASEIMRARVMGLPPINIQAVSVNVGTLGKTHEFWYICHQ